MMALLDDIVGLCPDTLMIMLISKRYRGLLCSFAVVLVTLIHLLSNLKNNNYNIGQRIGFFDTMLKYINEMYV